MAAASTKDLLTVFSPDGGYLALTSGDGRIKTWDVVSGQMRVEFVDITATTSGVGTATGLANGHLAVEYTAIAWGRSLFPAQKKAKKKSGASLLLALGTGSGDVLAWDTALGELRWRKDDVNPGGVKSIFFSRNGQRLYTAGIDGMICELDGEDGRVIQKFKGSKAPLSSVTLSPGGDNLLAASSEIKLFDLSTKKRIRKFSGHPATVKAMIFTDDGRYILSSALGDRHVAVWDCEQGKAETGAVFTLPMEQPAVALDCSGFGNDGGTVRVLALSERGVTYVWIATSVEGLAKVKPVKISVGPEKSSGDIPGKTSKCGRSCILAARLLEATGDESGAVLVARGTIARPQFERVPLDGISSSIILSGAITGDLLSGGRQVTGSGKAAGLHDVSVLGPDNAVDAVLSKAHLELGLAQKSPRKEKKRRASIDLDDDQQFVEHSELAGAEPDVSGAMDVDVDQEPTMEDQLVALGLIESVEKSAGDNMEAAVIVPKADSLQILLSQAIQSDDNALLERCIGLTDDRVISNTVSRLHAQDAAKFLRLMVFRMETRPRRGLMVVPWIRAALLHHASTLVSNPSMQPVLASLYQIIDARISVFRPLLSLSGRLDLILAQMPSEDQQPKDEGPAFVYEDESSEPESEDVMDEPEERVDESEDDESNEEEELTLRPNGNGPLQDDESDDEIL